MSCIIPATMGGGTAFELSFSEGFSGSPGRSVVKFVNEDGDYQKPKLSTSSPQQVGFTGKTRTQVPVKYSIDKSPEKSIMTVVFEDKGIIDLKKLSIFLAPSNTPAPPDTPCVKTLGRIYHKSPSAPARANFNDYAVPGPSPVNASGKKISTEQVMFNSADLAGAIGGLVGPGLSNAIANSGKLFASSGAAMSLVIGIARDNGWELFANDDGKLDFLSSTSAAPGNITNVGNQCDIISMVETGDLTKNTSSGGFAKYVYENNFDEIKKERFRSIDFLGIPMHGCGGGYSSLLSPGMEDEDILDLKRLMKMAYIGANFNNWGGFESWLMLKRSGGGGKYKVCRKEGVSWSYSTSGVGSDTSYGPHIMSDPTDLDTGAEIEFSNFQHVFPSSIVDDIFSCMSVCRLNLEETDIDVNKVFEAHFNNGPNTDVNKVPSVAGGAIEIVLLEAPDGESESKGKWNRGRNAGPINFLKVMAETLGRFWFVPGAGGGGGAKLMKRSHYRERRWVSSPKPEFYEKDRDVRETVFRSVYETFFKRQLQEYEDAGGIAQPTSERAKHNGDQVFVQPKHLSVSQFLHLAAKLKSAHTVDNYSGDSPQKLIDSAFTNGKAKSGGEYAKEEADAKAQCKLYDPLGVVIYDSGDPGIDLPDEDDTLLSMSEGVNVLNDKLGETTVSGLVDKGFVFGLMYNPASSSVPVEPGEQGQLKEPTSDSIDDSLDAFGNGSIFEAVGKRLSRKLDYKTEVNDFYSDARSVAPVCDGNIYSVSFGSNDLSGKVLRVNRDCDGGVSKLNRVLNGAEKMQIAAALGKAAADMYSVNISSDSQTDVKTCGSGPANMPSASQGLQGFNIRQNKNGSVNTSFSVGGGVRSAAFAGMMAGLSHERNAGAGKVSL